MAKKKAKQHAPKPKEEKLEIDGEVTELLPSAMFRVKLDKLNPDEENEKDHYILATLSGKIRKNYIRIAIGDKVTLDISPYDMTKGRITYRK